MQNESLKKILTSIVLIIVLLVAVKIVINIVGFVIWTLLPIAIVIVAGYIVYSFFIKKR